MKSRKYCIANWKMYLNNDQSVDFINRFNTFKLNNPHVQIVICPSFTSIKDVSVGNICNNYKIGSQDVSLNDEGPYTGQISINMIKNINCKYSIIGHSERREYCNEDDTLISEKFDLLHKTSIIPIVCIGETIKERENNQAKEIIENQLVAVFNNKDIDLSKEIIIAYEPIWAIGTGLSADNNTIEIMHFHIQNSIKKIIPNNCNIYILYGGSVNENNAADIIKIDNVDGFLIGSSSLDPDNFFKIYKTL